MDENGISDDIRPPRNHRQRNTQLEGPIDTGQEAHLQKDLGRVEELGAPLNVMAFPPGASASADFAESTKRGCALCGLQSWASPTLAYPLRVSVILIALVIESVACQRHLAILKQLAVYPTVSGPTI